MTKHISQDEWLRRNAIKKQQGEGAAKVLIIFSIAVAAYL